MSFCANLGCALLRPGGVMGPETAQMARMKLTAPPVVAIPTSSCVRMNSSASLRAGCVMGKMTAMMVQMNVGIALE